MRIGTNPIKIKKPPLSPPKQVTAVIITHIPYLSGYFQNSLEVLKLSLNSIRENTEEKFDLLVFDNNSCEQVQEYLLSQKDHKKIQYLILSDDNVGIPGAWNISFNAAPGKYVAFSDYDIYYYQGWLKQHLNVIDSFPDVGMVTGTPIRPPIEFSSKTLAWAEGNQEAEIDRGVLQTWEDFWTHAKSIGLTLEESQDIYKNGEDILIDYKGNQVFIGAGHFQFVALKEVLDKITPFPNTVAMGNERLLDQRINDLGLLRLSLTSKYVQHLGNAPDKELLEQFNDIYVQKKQGTTLGIFSRFWRIPIVKRILLRVYNQIFDIYKN